MTLQKYLNFSDKKYADLKLKIKESGIPHEIIYKRITKYCWPIKRALTEPLNNTKKKSKD